MSSRTDRETESTSSPLLNDYKRDFVLKRLLQTLLGGIILKFNPELDVPWFIYVLQLLLFTIPFFIGGISILIHDLIKSNTWSLYISIIAGCVYFVYFITIKLVAVTIKNKAYAKESENLKKIKSTRKSNLLNDEQSYHFGKLFSHSTLDFLLPSNDIFVTISNSSKKIAKRKFLICFSKIFIDGLVSGFIMFCSVYFESINYLQNFYPLGGSIVLFILHWIVLSITFYSLCIRNPPEPAIYQPDDQYNIHHFTRSFYVLCFQLIEVIYK